MIVPEAERDARDDEPGDRASATPIAQVRAGAGAGLLGAAPIEGPAEALMAWFQAVITDPDGGDAGEAGAALGAATLEDLVTSSARLGAAARLAIYQHGYRERLVECVLDDLRLLARALDPATRAALARAYVEGRPSRSWDLVPYASEVPAFLERLAAAPPPWWESPLPLPAAQDLARLDLAIAAVTHEPLAPPMPMAALGGVPEADWPAVRLVPGRALRLLALEHDVHALAKAVVAGAPWPSTAPRPSWVAVWREGRDIWRMALSETAHAVLLALVRGATLGDALAAVPEDCGEDVMRWFGAWVSSGFFAGFEVASG